MKTLAPSRIISIVSFFILTIVATSLIAQTAFEGQTIVDTRSVIETSDGGFILAGKTRSITKGKSRAYLIKTDAECLSSEFPLTQIESGTKQ